MQLFGKPLNLIILDVDGVIVDVSAYLRDAMTVTAERLALPTAPIHEHFAAPHDGNPWWGGFQDRVRMVWPHLDADGVMEYAWRFQEVRRENPWPTITGSIETIGWLQSKGLPVALCTTNDLPTLEHQLNAVGLRLDQFAVVSTWESGHPKPDSLALKPIFDATPVPREASAYIGDWWPDLHAAPRSRGSFHCSALRRDSAPRVYTRRRARRPYHRAPRRFPRPCFPVIKASGFQRRETAGGFTANRLP